MMTPEVEVLVNSVSAQVLQTAVFLLAELASRDDSIAQTLNRVDADVYCLVKKGLAEAVSLLYLLAPTPEQLVEMDMAVAAIRCAGPQIHLQCRPPHRLRQEPRRPGRELQERRVVCHVWRRSMAKPAARGKVELGSATVSDASRGGGGWQDAPVHCGGGADILARGLGGDRRLTLVDGVEAEMVARRSLRKPAVGSELELVSTMVGHGRFTWWRRSDTLRRSVAAAADAGERVFISSTVGVWAWTGLNIA
jgi:hypothetical protein